MFNQYPYLNLNDLNLDYILKVIKEMRYEVTNFVSINAIKYADPIQWNITTQYEKNTIVIDPVTGTAYISVAPVPAGVSLTRPEYWTVVFDLGSFVTRAAQNFTSHWESETTTTATFPTSTGSWLVWGDVLYRALTNITAGDTYVIGGNIEHFTIEDLYNEYLNTVATIYSAIDELTANIHDAFTYSNEHENTTFSISRGNGSMFWWHGKLYRTTTAVSAGDAIDVGNNCERFTMEMALVDVSNSLTSISNNIGNLSNLTTTDKSNLVNAINEIAAQVLGKIGDLDNLNTQDKSNLVNAINEVDLNEKNLQLEVGDLNQMTVPSPADVIDGVNKVWSRTLAVEHRVDMYHKVSYKKALLISDSYGVASDSWPYQFETITGMDCDVYAYSGCGFYTNQANSILSNFQNETFTDAQKAAVTDIIACLGANDIATCTAGDITSLISEIGNFVNYCKSNFPNAEIYIGMCGYVLYGYTAAGTANVANYLNVLAAYQLGASQADAYYLSGVEFPLHYYYNISFVDGIHPTTAGKTALARAIAGAWKNGSYSYKGDGAYLYITPVTGIQIDGSSDPASLGLAYIENEVTWLAMNKRLRVVASPPISIGDTFVKIADITTPRSFYANGSEYEIPITAQAAMYDIDGSTLVNVPMILQFKNGELNIKSLYINSGVFETHTYSTMYLTLTNQQIMTLVN